MRSAMIHREDRRVQRTRQLIENAFIELTIKKGYEKVTVQDIVDRANVGRATFYAHYQDKEDLFARSIQRFFDFLTQELARENIGKTDLLPAEAIFRHVEDHAPIHKGFGATELLRKKFHQQLVSLITDRLEVFAAQGHPVNLPREVCANYFAGALLALIEWWLEEEPHHTAEKMAAMYQQLVRTALPKGRK